MRRRYNSEQLTAEQKRLNRARTEASIRVTILRHGIASTLQNECFDTDSIEWIRLAITELEDASKTYDTACEAYYDSKPWGNRRRRATARAKKKAPKTAGKKAAK